MTHLPVMLVILGEKLEIGDLKLLVSTASHTE